MKVVFLVTLAVLVIATGAPAQYDGQAIGTVGEVTAPPDGQAVTPPPPTFSTSTTPPPAPRHQTRDGCEEATRQVLRGNFALRGHSHPEYAPKGQTHRFAEKVSRNISNSYNKNTFNFVTPPPPLAGQVGQPAQPAPSPAIAGERKKGMEQTTLAWIIVVAVICATVYGGMYRVHQTEQLRIAAETARINAAAERREEREAAERERKDALEREKLALVRQAVVNQGKFAPDNSPAGLVETGAQIDGVGVFTARADNRPYGLRPPLAQPGQAAAAVSRPAATAAATAEPIDPNAQATAGAAA